MKLRTAEEIHKEIFKSERRLIDPYGLIIECIETAQREAIEAAVKNANVIYTCYQNSNEISCAEVDKKSILKLLPEE